MIDIAAERAAVIVEAQRWLGTPYHHAQRLRGHGVDCAHFLIAVYADACQLVTPFEPQRYGKKWYLHESTPRLLQEMAEHCVLVDAPTPGDIPVFQFGRAVAHGGILIDPTRMIHADATTGRVTIDSLAMGQAFHERLAGYWSLRRWQGA